MANWIDFKLDSKQIEKAIKGTKLNINTILVKCQTAVNRAVIKSAKARFRSLFNVNNHSNYTLTNASAENNAGDNAKPVLKNFKTQKNRREKGSTFIRNFTYYAKYLEKGAHIEAKNKKYLTFKVDGEWKKVQSVTVPARPFFEPAVKEFWETSKHIPIQEAVLQKELEKYWEKNK